MKKITAILIAVLSVLVLEYYNSTKPRHIHAGFNITELVPRYGYTIENHEVVTEDGYILTVHRIPSKNPTKGPVLLMHGMFLSGTDYVVMGPKRSLAFLLTDRGYDVWIGNFRGTTWSRKHKVFDPDKNKEFWDFRMDEMGLYDLPAFIDYILGVTKQDSLYYIGFSQGCSTFLILGSEKPQYLSKVKLMSAMAPAVFIGNPTGPLWDVMVRSWRTQEYLYDYFNFWELYSHSGFFSRVLRHVCNDQSLFVNLCIHVKFMIVGYNYDELDKGELSLISANLMAGVSSKQFLQLIQWMDSGDFHKYDFGAKRNLEKYGQEKPPLYNLSNITTPVALYYGNNDWLVNPQNMKKFVSTINVTKNYEVPMAAFNHDNFMNAKRVVDLVYRELLEEMEKY